MMQEDSQFFPDGLEATLVRFEAFFDEALFRLGVRYTYKNHIFVGGMVVECNMVWNQEFSVRAMLHLTQAHEEWLAGKPERRQFHARFAAFQGLPKKLRGELEQLWEMRERAEVLRRSFDADAEATEAVIH